MSEPNPHGQGGSPYGPSPAAVERTHDAIFDAGFEPQGDDAQQIAAAGYDPALGFDASVCKAAVLGFLEDPAHGMPAHPNGHPHLLYAAHLLRQEWANA